MSQPSTTSDIIVFIVPHSHWDREWYLPFQSFRYRLVEVMTRLLRYMESHSAYKFTFDGQSIVIRDFLELEPDEESRLRMVAREGRLLFGPWFVQPDEWLVSGESLVRNLELGLTLAKQHGKPLMVGHVPDMFGHVPQLPEIFRLFDINHVVLWRGVPPTIESSPFWWQSPSGKKVLTTYLFDSYSNGAYLPLEERELEHAIEQMISRSRRKLNVPVLLLMNGTDHAPPQLGLEKTVERMQKNKKREVRLGTLQEYVDVLRAVMQEREWQLPTWSGELRDPTKAPILSGVLSARLPLKQWNARLQRLHEDYLFPLSTVVHRLGGTPPMSRVHRSLEMLIENHSHDCIGGCSVDLVHDEMAQRFRSTEQLATSILGTLKHQLSRLIPIDGRSLESVQDRLSTTPVIIVNPHSFPVKGPIPIEFEIDPLILNPTTVKKKSLLARMLENDQSCVFYCQDVTHEVILDYGVSPFHLNRLPYVLERFQNQGWHYHSHELVRRENADYPDIYIHMTRSTLARKPFSLSDILTNLNPHDIPDNRFIRVLIRSLPIVKGLLFLDVDLPPFSWIHVTLTTQSRDVEEHEPRDRTTVTNHSFHGKWYSMELSSEGELSLTLDPSLTGSPISLPRLLFFEDEGDAGDEYNFSPVLDAPLRFDRFSSWEATESSPKHQTVLLRYLLTLPTQLSENRRHRSEKTVDCPVTVYMTLYKTLPRIDFQIKFVNKAKDHRLRVGFSLPFLEHVLWSSSAFYVIAREFPPTRASSDEAVEQVASTVPQLEFSTILHDPLKLGITLINDGLPEIELTPRETDGTTELKLTILRSVGWLSRDDLVTRRGHAGPAIKTPGAQCLGEHAVSFSLYFHSVETSWAAVHAMAKSLLSPPVTIQSSGGASQSLQAARDVSSQFLTISGRDVVVTSMEPVEKGIKVRLVNFSDAPTITTIHSSLMGKKQLKNSIKMAPWEIRNVIVPFNDLRSFESA